MPGSTTRRRLLRTGAATLATTGLAGVATSARTEDSPYTVTTATFQFVPEVLTVPHGATVRWVRGGPVFHTVTSASSLADAYAGNHNEADEDAFDEPLGPPVELTFDEAGRYPYFCRPHHELGMVGEIAVVG